MLQLYPLPATPFLERLRIAAGRRTLAISLALSIEVFLLLLLLSLGSEEPPLEREGAVTVVHLEAAEVQKESPQQRSPEPAQLAEEQPVAERPVTGEELTPKPAEPLPALPAESRSVPAVPAPLPSPETKPPAADVPPNIARPAPSGSAVYGPPDTGGSSSYRDTERVGTAPNGEPLYAAAWYREPTADQLRGYLSSASGPGWGLIACRTVPEYRVEDCVGLDEYPHGSQINRAVLAAAWEFKVRPPRLGGRTLVGSWVRIRIDYGIKRR